MHLQRVEELRKQVKDHFEVAEKIETLLKARLQKKAEKLQQQEADSSQRYNELLEDTKSVLEKIQKENDEEYNNLADKADSLEVIIPTESWDYYFDKSVNHKIEKVS